MNRKPHREGVYGPMLAKTFPNVLSCWLAEEFPHLGGPKVRELFVREVMRLVEAHYIPSQRLQPGQTVRYAVDKTDRPHGGHMAETRLVPVTLTPVTQEDIERLIKGVPLTEVRRHVVARLHREVDAQGEVLAETDTGLLLCQRHGTISDAIRAYEQEHQCIIPRRGTVHDLGRSVSHKAFIAKRNMPRSSELNLNDDQLPSIMTQLEHRAWTRQRDAEDGSASRELAPGTLTPG